MTSIVKIIPVCSASLDDINKALRAKPSLSSDTVRVRLPEQVRDFAHLFADDEGAKDLPPLRGKLDHEINIRKENGKFLTSPWGPLYNMSREELLVLRKPLTDQHHLYYLQKSLMVV